MKHRQQILLAILGATVLWYVGDWLLQDVLRGPLESRRQRTAQLQATIETRQKQLAAVRRDGRQLLRWWSQSLPSDGEIARSLYKAWLLELVVHAGLADPHVDPGAPVNRKGLFTVLSFAVRGRGTLEQLTKFLFEFYRADHLHQIRAVGITPLPKTDELNLSFSVEALVLPGANRKDRLSDRQADRLASQSLDDYEVILRRNLFGYGGTPEAVEHTVLTRVASVDDRPQATFTVRTTDERFTAGEGEVFKIGPFRATVVEIHQGDVIIESGGERWLLSIGERLSDAFALPPER